MIKKNLSKQRKGQLSPSSSLKTHNIEANGLTYPLGRIITASKRLEQIRKANIKREEIIKERERTWLENEHQKYSIKLKLATEIFDWCQKFTKSSEYRRLIKLRKSSLLYSQTPIYTDGFGLVKMGSHKGNYLCMDWSQIFVSNNGKYLLYAHHHKFVSETFTFKNPKEFAIGLNYEYLNKFHKSIASGKLKKDFEADLVKDIEKEIKVQLLIRGVRHK